MTKNKKIQWRKFSDPEQVKAELQANLPDKATVVDVKQFAASQEFECSELVDNIIYCSTPAKNFLLIFEAKWLIQFQFRSNRLVEIHVEIGRTAL